MSGRLYCLASTESKSSAASALAISVFTRLVREARVADHVARVACNHQAAGVPLVRGQGQLRREALRLHQRLVADHDQLALARPAVPLVGHLQLAPARPVLRQEEIVREVGGVGHGERVGGEELRRGDRAPARHVAADHVDTPPLVAVKVQSSGPVEAAPVMVSVAPVSAPVAAKLAAVAAPEAVSVPVDTSPTVVKFPALAVLMVRVPPVIPVAELSRPTLAAPVMLSELKGYFKKNETLQTRWANQYLKTNPKPLQARWANQY